MKANASRMRKCPHCDGTVARSKRERTSAVAGTWFVARVDTYACRRCRAVFLAGPALERLDLEIACFLARRASPSGETLRFLRKALGLRGVALASLLQVTAETLSRWERGQRGVDANAWITVGSLVLEKSGRPTATYERLSALAEPRKLPATVRIDLDHPAKSYRLRVTRARAKDVAIEPAAVSIDLRTGGARS